MFPRDTKGVQDTQAGGQANQWIVEEGNQRAEPASLESPKGGDIEDGHSGQRNIAKHRFKATARVIAAEEQRKKG
jgi:hypothetical protein